MKHLLLITVLIALTCQLGFGSILRSLPTPQDDSQIHRQLSRREELKPFAGRLWDLVENRICPLKRNGIDRIFGPALSESPKDMVLPIFAPGSIFLDGLGRPEFHSIGRFGYIECYYQIHGDTNDLVQWGWFHRADDDFVPVRSADDFEKRLEWDEAKLAGITKWLDEHLPKFKDLGIVEVSASAPTRIALGNGNDCIITTRIDTSAASTNYWFHAIVTTDTTKTIRKPLITANEVIGFSAGSDCYTALLRLIRPPLKDLGKVEFLEDTPTPLDLGGGWQCDVTASHRRDGGVSLRFGFRSSDVYQTWVSELGDSLCFTTEGMVFKLTPLLKTK